MKNQSENEQDSAPQAMAGDCYTQREQTAGELRAIMARRERDNSFVNEQVMEMVRHYRDQGEADAARIYVLEESMGEAIQFMQCARNGLHYMQAEWGPLFQAMMERQDVLKTLLDQIRIKAINGRGMENEHTAKVFQTIMDLTGKMAAALLNDYGQGEPGECKESKESLYYCPTCKRHVHPEDLIYSGDGPEHIHHAHRNQEGALQTVCPFPVEVRGIDKDPPCPKPSRVSEEKVEAYERRTYLEELDRELTNRGVRRTKDDTEIIRSSFEAGESPATCAHGLARMARLAAPF